MARSGGGKPPGGARGTRKRSEAGARGGRAQGIKHHNAGTSHSATATVPRVAGAAGKITTSTNATTAPTTGELATSHTITGRAAACAYVALGAAATE